MGYTMSQKIIKNHLVEGEMVAGSEIGIRIDQTLTQDSTGTMAYLQLEAMNIPRVKTKKSVAYIDHNMLQEGFENADDHKYIQTVAKKHGVYFSKPGNGICHQVHLERFGVPGDTLVGSDSHTPTNGGIGMLAIGAGGLDVAMAMAGRPYYLKMPKVVRVELVGSLLPYVSAKDIILEVLRRLSVKGGVGRVLEYVGSGVKTLTVPERSTITNMGAELGATTSLFPSDEVTLAFLRAQGREGDYSPLQPDADAVYDESISINLSELVPMVAKPHSPDNVDTVASIKGFKVDQIAIGSCTNGSYLDLMKVASILKGKTVHPDVSLVIAPGSKQVLTMLAENGALADLVGSGARILESGCGPCIGMGQAPATNAVSLRTFNRNFYGRCGTNSASVYLVSPEVAAASALAGVLVDPTELTDDLCVTLPEMFKVSDNMILSPCEMGEEVEVVRGPNIQPFPLNEALGDMVTGEVLLKTVDNITTDHIMPSNAKLLPFRSNIPHLANFCFQTVDEGFSARAKEKGGGIVVGGANYGQGSSREHAALVPLYLGVKAVVAKSFARIHQANLMNSGILPLTFMNESDFDKVDEGDVLEIVNVKEQILSGTGLITVTNITKQIEIPCELHVSDRERDMLLSGGAILSIRNGEEKPCAQ